MNARHAYQTPRRAQASAMLKASVTACLGLSLILGAGFTVGAMVADRSGERFEAIAALGAEEWIVDHDLSASDCRSRVRAALATYCHPEAR